jgi:hypothetical protein
VALPVDDEQLSSASLWWPIAVEQLPVADRLDVCEPLSELVL